MIYIKEIQINHESDSGIIRRRVSTLAELCQLSKQDTSKFTTAISELVRNVIKYGNSGEITFYITEEAPQELVAIVQDHGPGIENLSEILSGNYKSSSGLGLGLRGAKRLCDSFEIETGKEGTKVKIGIVLPVAIEIDPETLVEWLNKMKAETNNYLDIVKENNQELTAAYKEIKQQQKALIKANENLRKKTEELAARNQEIQDFANLVAHDLKAPLNNILILAAFVKEEQNKLKLEKFSQMIEEQSNKMKDFINQVLNFSKAAGKTAETETLEIKAFLEKLLNYLQFKEDVKIKLDFEETEVTFNPSELQTVFQNLLTNAVKYNSSEIKKVKITLDELENSYHIKIKDNGIGLSPEQQSQLFRFGKILSDMALEESSGVGLALIKRIIEKHNGEIWVKSELGKGSTFQFTIPKKEAAQ